MKEYESDELVYTISYKGKTKGIESGIKIISDEYYNKLREDWYRKPDKDLVLRELKKFINGGNKTTNIVKYYYRDLMDNTQTLHSKWCINDIFDSKELLSWVVYKITTNSKVFDGYSMNRNIDTVFRLGGSGVANRVSNFPLPICDDILHKYNVNNNYYDFSCGWGARLMCSLRAGINYYGTDPNYLLVDKLNQFYDDYKSLSPYTPNKKIYCQGSEVFIPELENKIGLAFSSPPYFNLEDYKVGNQSYKEGTTFDDWVNDYLRPTFKNIYRYLVNDGYFIINIKDFDNIPLEQTCKDVAIECGFIFHKYEELKQSFRVVKDTSEESERKEVSQNENIYVFTKVKKDENNLFDFVIDNKQIEIREKREHKVKEQKEQEDENELIDLW